MPFVISPKIIALLYPLAVVAMFATLFTITNSFEFVQLNRDGISTHATITSYDPNNHCTITYTFSVRSRPYSGSGSLCSAQPGSDVLVTYLQSNPFVSCLGKANDSLLNNLIPIFLASLMAPAFFMISLFRAKAR